MHPFCHPQVRVVFVDWHGVLSADRFLESIFNSPRVILKGALEQRFRDIFSDRDLGSAWMRGQVSTRQILTPVRRALYRHYGDDFLERKMIWDCRQMKIDAQMAALLDDVPLDTRLVVATDNVVEFAGAFRQAQASGAAHRRGEAANSSTMEELSGVFDSLICSAEVGVLKHSDPYRFFGGWLGLHGLDFSDALLIDDREDNCTAFMRAGGQALLWPESKPGRMAAAAELRSRTRVRSLPPST